MSKKKAKGRKLKAHQLKHEVLKLLKRQPKKRLTARQIIKKLKILNNKDAVQYALETLTNEGHLYQIDTGVFKYDEKQTKSPGQPSGAEVIGKVDMTKSGAAYIVSEHRDQDIYISPSNVGRAMHGDTVKVRAFVPRGRRKPEGKILEIVERAKEYFLGAIRVWKNYALLTPDDYYLKEDIFVPLDQLHGAKDQDKVVVQITDWPKRKNQSLRGKVTVVLGKEGSNDVEMQAILIKQGFNIAFPPEVLQEAEQLSGDIMPDEVQKRRDMREVSTFTIDPHDAKDFDDALSIRHLENGHIEVGIHIADVTHYVKPGSALDKEAYLRSTSVYLVDRVCPMLPESLSNGHCSLRPKEDKHTFSAVFVFDKDTQIVDRWFGKTLTHSDRRFAYEEAQEIIESGNGDFAKELHNLNKIAQTLRKRRYRNGSINFETDEVRFRLDEKGVPIQVYIKDRKEAHLLVEDFMLLANKEVATYMVQKDKNNSIPYIFRIHDTPDEDKLAEFALFAKQFGVQMDLRTPKSIAKSFNHLQKMAEQNEILKMLAPMGIRTMAKAAYSTDNIGHYGLGFQNYSHFTSPIRRYSDVLAHRILFDNLKGAKRYNQVKLEEQCAHISAQERKAQEAERESIKYKQVEFMERHVGHEFDGVVSGIIERGFFVELVASKCEGMIEFSSMGEPFDVQSRYQAIGTYSKHKISMGDQVRVRILGTDLQKRNIDMEWVPIEEKVE